MLCKLLIPHYYSIIFVLYFVKTPTQIFPHLIHRISLRHVSAHTSSPLFCFATWCMLFYIIFCAIYFQYLSVHLAIISWLEDFPFLFFSSFLLRLPGVCSWLSNWYAIFSLFLLLHILIYVLFDFHIEREEERDLDSLHTWVYVCAART